MRVSDKFMVSSVGGENVILPIDNECVDYNSVFMLNDTAMFIISSLPASYDEIIQKLTDNYEVSREDAMLHLDNFLKETSKYGIIE